MNKVFPKSAATKAALSAILLLQGCSQTLSGRSTWLDYLPYIGIVAAVLLFRFLLKLFASKPLLYPVFDSSEQKGVYESSPEFRKVAAQLDDFIKKDPEFDTETFLEWVNHDITEVLHAMYWADADSLHEMRNQYLALPVNERKKIFKSKLSLQNIPIEWLTPLCTQEMMWQLEREIGTERGAVTGTWFYMDGAHQESGIGDSFTYEGGDGECRGRTYRWNSRGDRFWITRIWQEEGLDHIEVQEQREVSEVKHDQRVKHIGRMPLIRYVLEETIYAFSRPSGGKDWRLYAKSGKKLTDRRERTQIVNRN